MHTEHCPDCGVELPVIEGGGAVHSYVGASASCWALFANFMAGEPALAPRATNALIFDAYIAQHHGVPSPQAIQSVAVHLLVLYGVLHAGLAPEKALWIRQRATRPEQKRKTDRFHWLTPPNFAGCPTLAEVVAMPTPEARASMGEAYVRAIWSSWAKQHLNTLKRWYAENIVVQTG